MSTPTIHLPDKIATWGHSVSPGDLFLAARQYRQENEVVPIVEDVKDKDRQVIRLLLIDCQQDFTSMGGVMYQEGVEEVTERICQFIYENAGTLTSVTPISTNHFPFQIFFPAFWTNEKGESPEPDTLITAEDVENDVWKPVPELAEWLASGNEEWLTKQIFHYLTELEEKDHKLTIKMEHCLHGTQGQTLNGCVDAARLFHSYVRNVQAEVELIDAHPLVESYSVFGPLVQTRHDGVEPVAWRNVPILRSFLRADKVLIAGFNRVQHTGAELLEILDGDPVGKKIHLLTDCIAEDLPDALKMKRRLSTVPLTEWDDEDEDDG